MIPAGTASGRLPKRLKPALLRLAAHYFLIAKGADGRPIDPVARFHLGNGARLERINWLGDTSSKGLREAHGLMVNYRYELRDIERNHEAYENDGAVAASKQVPVCSSRSGAAPKPPQAAAVARPAHRPYGDRRNKE